MFDFEVILYLLLGGLGGGLAAVSGFAFFRIPAGNYNEGTTIIWPDFMGHSFIAASAMILLGGMLLLVDAGNHSALPYLFLSFTPSYLFVGSWLLVITFFLCIILALFWKTRIMPRCPKLVSFAHFVCCLMGLGTALYTGLFLASMRAVPLWNTAWLPVLFLGSSVSGGITLFSAFMQMFTRVRSFLYAACRFVKADIALIAVEAIGVVGFLSFSFVAPFEGATAIAGSSSVNGLIFGEYAPTWWIGFVGCGLIAMLVFDVLILRLADLGQNRIWSTLGVSVCALVGSFSLRYCIVMAGMHPALGF